MSCRDTPNRGTYDPGLSIPALGLPVVPHRPEPMATNVRLVATGPPGSY